jgi:DNA-binding MurR/RpiR family transcriptional regulator
MNSPKPSNLVAETKKTRENVLDVLRTRLDEFSPKQQVVGRFVLARFEEAVFLTAADVASRVGTSEASVVRTARRLGYSGFPEFREDLQVLFREKVLPADRMRYGASVSERPDAILDRVVEQALANIRETQKLVDTQSLLTGAQAIVSARIRYVIGTNASAGAAQLLGHQLSRIQPHVRVHTESGPGLFDPMLSLGKEDVVIAFSYPRYAKSTIDFVLLAKKKGATTLVITDSVLSPIAHIAHLTLVARADPISFAYSYAASTCVIDALVAAVVNLDREAALARLAEFEDALKEHDFFYPGGPLSEGNRG